MSAIGPSTDTPQDTQVPHRARSAEVENGKERPSLERETQSQGRGFQALMAANGQVV